jgi:hypothetical protein
MGNPHVREVELAWLAGIIDGEGTITLERSGKRRLSGVMGLAPKIIIANSDQVIIQRVVNLMQLIGANPHIKSQEAGYARPMADGSRTVTRRKTMYWVVVSGLAKSKRVLVPILPHLIGKSAQARIILDFVEIRGDSAKAKGKPYGEAELNMLEQIRALNFRGTSETEDHGIRRRIYADGMKVTVQTQ